MLSSNRLMFSDSLFFPAEVELELLSGDNVLLVSENELRIDFSEKVGIEVIRVSEIVSREFDEKVVLYEGEVSEIFFVSGRGFVSLKYSLSGGSK